ncbi:uncharacterized protein EI90DRAFT_3290595 [Cantharellus anzutake]|uniref:uncharacterized protein n=1 Tax=Cantharellus anzutake TaxID=1750568 RepID=UPI001905A64F|nr:uncharacterized protein EI90DRAFT_3290595 [Cantharellus anzutake]KAF8328429.1 hypothetical protein EI90DRAFT_3290595 [Cantharellus anzutake]
MYVFYCARASCIRQPSMFLVAVFGPCTSKEHGTATFICRGSWRGQVERRYRYRGHETKSTANKQVEIGREKPSAVEKPCQVARKCLNRVCGIHVSGEGGKVNVSTLRFVRPSEKRKSVRVLSEDAAPTLGTSKQKNACGLICRMKKEMDRLNQKEDEIWIQKVKCG